jgi:hypothetical protein
MVGMVTLTREIDPSSAVARSGHAGNLLLLEMPTSAFGAPPVALALIFVSRPSRFNCILLTLRHDVLVGCLLGLACPFVAGGQAVMVVPGLPKGWKADGT